MSDSFFDRKKGHEATPHAFENKLDALGITPEQQDTKIRNLSNFGSRVVRKIAHDKYKVEGFAGFYNPYTDKWGHQ